MYESKLKVGDRVADELDGGVVVGHSRKTGKAIVESDMGSMCWEREDDFYTLIPDTMLVELRREDIEYWAGTGRYSAGVAGRFSEACKKALEGE